MENESRSRPREGGLPVSWRRRGSCSLCRASPPAGDRVFGSLMGAGTAATNGSATKPLLPQPDRPEQGADATAHAQVGFGDELHGSLVRPGPVLHVLMRDGGVDAVAES